MRMKRIPSSEFTKAPAGHLEDVFRGETIMVTRYGRPYVVISPPPPGATKEKEAEKKVSPAG